MSELLYSMVGSGEALTAAAIGQLVPNVKIPANFMYPGRVLRGRLSGITSSVITTPGTAEFKILYGPRPWAASYKYEIGDLVFNDDTGMFVCVAPLAWVPLTAYDVDDMCMADNGKGYICVTKGTSSAATAPSGTGSSIADGTAEWDYVGVALVSDSSGGPTGTSAGTLDLGCVWDYVSAIPEIADSGALVLDTTGAHSDDTWLLEFEIVCREAGAPGLVVCSGTYQAGNQGLGDYLPRRLIPSGSLGVVNIDTTVDGFLHFTYESSVATAEIICLSYTLEALN